MFGLRLVTSLRPLEVCSVWCSHITPVEWSLSAAQAHLLLDTQNVNSASLMGVVGSTQFCALLHLNNGVTLYWHNLEYTFISLQQGGNVNHWRSVKIKSAMFRAQGKKFANYKNKKEVIDLWHGRESKWYVNGVCVHSIMCKWSECVWLIMRCSSLTWDSWMQPQ